MASTLIYIRHMVCSKCIRVVREHLVALGLAPLRVELGEVEVRTDADAIDWPRLRQCLEQEGFEILDQLSPPQRLVARIKAVVTDLLRTDPASLRSGHLSKQLSQRLSRRFTYLSDVFSATEGHSLEQYVIRQRIGAARSLLTTSALPVGRIAHQLGFSSLSHLSRQFQREMGASPSDYRRGLAAEPGGGSGPGQAKGPVGIPSASAR